MKSYRVYLGAPSASDIDKGVDEYQWQTVSESSATPVSQRHVDITLPATAIDNASKRISALYENIIFREDDDEGHYLSVLGVAPSVRSDVDAPGDPTSITWLPITQDATDVHEATKSDFTFLRPTASLSRFRLARETQETQETGSYDYSEASSVGKFPDFHFGIHSLTSLSRLITQALSNIQEHRNEGTKTSQKVTLLVAVLEVEGPDTIRIKKGVEAGREVALLKLILGDEEGAVCKLTAWREVAESWGGVDPDETTSRVKRGDVVLLESVLASWGSGEPRDSEAKDSKVASPVTLTASSNMKSRMEICYRTMPLLPDDSRFRPDLRLGFSDASVRKVATVVEWFETTAGLTNGNSDAG